MTKPDSELHPSNLEFMLSSMQSQLASLPGDIHQPTNPQHQNEICRSVEYKLGIITSRDPAMGSRAIEHIRARTEYLKDKIGAVTTAITLGFIADQFDPALHPTDTSE